MTRRRTFGPVVLLGLAGAGLTAVAGNRAVAEADDYGAFYIRYDAHMPAATALGLVVLACWGVVLVTRGRFRRAIAALGVLASVGAVVAVVAAWSQVPARLRDEYTAVGVSDLSYYHTVWWYLGALGALVSLVATLLAVAWAPQWPEMGAKYDAPGAAAVPDPAAGEAPEEQSSLDLWKALDEGRDPTARDSEQPE